MSYGTSSADDILDSASYAGPDQQTPFDGSGPRVMLADPPTLPSAGSTPRHSGQGFDTCTAPSSETMRAWLASPFRTVGIYIGGVNRACADGNLSASWVQTNARLGWRMLPIYVGRQAPCALAGDLGPILPTNIAQQGADAASDAVARARGFGLQPGTTIYFDMEAYDDTDAGCRSVVLTFLSAWTKGVHDLGYLSGVYSSAASGIRDLAGAYKSADIARPDAIWIARWNGISSVFNEPTVPNTYWGTHQRLKQYRGPHTETWGGRTLEIDSDVVDGPLAAAVYTFPVVSSVPLTARLGPSTVDSGGKDVGARCVPADRLSDLDRAEGRYQPCVGQAGRRYVRQRPARGHAQQDHRLPPDPEVPSGARGLGHRAQRAEGEQPVAAGDRHDPRRWPGVHLLPARGNAVWRRARVWNKLDTGGWVPDWYTVTPGRPGFTATIPRCP